MLLRKERLQENSSTKNKNQQWKKELDLQILQRQLEKQRESMVRQQSILEEEEKARKYTVMIANRDKEGSYSKSKRDPINRSQASISPPKKVQGSMLHNSNKNIHTDLQQEMPLFPMQSNTSIYHSHPKDTKPVKTEDDQAIVLSFAEEPLRKKRKSTAKKRLDTVQSQKNTQTNLPLQLLELQDQNRKLKQQLKKSSNAIDSIMRMLRGRPELETYAKEAEGILSGREIGFTEYVRIDRDSRVYSPTKVLFPSLDFKGPPIINSYNIVAAKKAQPLSTAAFK